MASAANTSFIDALRPLLEPKQAAELAGLQARFPDPKSLAKELIQRGWLTPYQANQLLNGKGRELLLGSYILLERLGEGGMGQVFKARHRNMGRIAAIKLIRKERVDNPNAVKRFQREVRAASALSHPNIVHAYDADEIGGTHLLVMEYIEGANDLSKLVKKNGALPVEKACDFIRQAALGLQHAYERGMVHRDIKPANLLLTSDEKTVKVLDMGLARLDHSGTEDDDKSSTMTQEGSVMGTPDYIAPEQAMDSHTVDIRADLYSLGCAFYFLLTGRVPFPGGTFTEKLLKHQMHEPQPVEKLRPAVPADVAKVVRKLMAKKPEDRFQTPAEVAAVLSGDRSKVAVAAMANSVTIADGKAEGSKDALASAFAYMEKRTDTVAFEPEKEKPKNWRWLLVGGVGSLFVVGLVIMLLVAFRGPEEKKQPEKEPPFQARKKEPPKKEEAVPPKYVTNSIGMKFVWIPPGSFVMGSPKNEPGRNPGEIQHKVTLTKGFYMSVYEVTQEEWQEVMGKNPSIFKGEKNLPVTNVSWEDCQEFLKRLTEKEGHVYRLPTEAEWEYSCRAGTTTAYSFGDTISTKQANFGDSPKQPTAVGSYPPNAWGLYDMHGNVYEWCTDWFGAFPNNDVVDPYGPNNGDIGRVLRGGQYSSQASSLRSASRYRNLPTVKQYGFRALRPLTP